MLLNDSTKTICIRFFKLNSVEREKVCDNFHMLMYTIFVFKHLNNLLKI